MIQTFAACNYNLYIMCIHVHVIMRLMKFPHIHITQTPKVRKHLLWLLTSVKTYSKQDVHAQVQESISSQASSVKGTCTCIYTCNNIHIYCILPKHFHKFYHYFFCKTDEVLPNSEVIVLMVLMTSGTMQFGLQTPFGYFLIYMCSQHVN